MKHSLDEFSSTLLLCTLSLSKYSFVSTALHTPTFLEMLHRQQGKQQQPQGTAFTSAFVLPVPYQNSPEHVPAALHHPKCFPSKTNLQPKSLLLSPGTAFNHSQHRNCEVQNNFVGGIASVLSHTTPASSAGTLFCIPVTQGLGMTCKILDKLLPVKHE